MLDIKDFAFFEKQNSFDFKAFLIKTASYWKWFVLGLGLSLFVAYQVNIRKQKIYALETTLAVKEQENPLFTNNTSLIFNWGGTSDQVQTIATTLKSRSHNELVVDKLSFYVDYLKENKYFTEDVYGYTPFVINLDKTKDQLFGVPISIQFKSPSEYELSIVFNSNSAPLINYSTNVKSAQSVVSGNFIKRFKVGQSVRLPFLNFTLEIKDIPGDYVGENFTIKMNSFEADNNHCKGKYCCTVSLLFD